MHQMADETAARRVTKCLPRGEVARRTVRSWTPAIQTYDMQIRYCVALVMLASCVLGASPMASDYLTEGNDPGRTGWMKDEKVFSPANVKDMKLL